MASQPKASANFRHQRVKPGKSRDGGHGVFNTEEENKKNKGRLESVKGGVGVKH